MVPEFRRRIVGIDALVELAALGNVGEVFWNLVSCKPSSFKTKIRRPKG